MDAIWTMLGVGLLVWALSSLFSLPTKKKEFTLTDQNEATHRALGGSRPPDSSDVIPPETTTVKKHH